MPYDLEKIWDGVVESIRLNASDGAVKTYLKGVGLMEVKEVNDRLIAEIGCPSMFIKAELEKRWWGQISQEMERQLGKKTEVVVKIKNIEKDKNVSDGLPLFEEKKFDNAVLKRANLREDYTFENYAVGGSNQMAFAAAQAVAGRPGTAYNPLFIYGGVGVGKTHLMQSIGAAVLKNSGFPVLFCSGEEFTNDLVEAIRLKSTEKVRTKYRRVRVLMIDDVQFIAGKPGVQEEFFHTFNAVQKEGGQIVMTSDRPPTEITKLEERLRSRFGAGLIVDVGQPNFELRTAILLIKSKQRNLPLDMKLAQLVAAQIEGIRELEGFLTTLTTEINFAHKNLDESLISTLLNIKPLKGDGARLVTPNEVMSVISNYYGIGIQQIKGERRTKSIAWSRQMLMYFLRKIVELPLEEVGRLIGGRDHSTVLHGSNKVEGLIVEDPKVASEVSEIRKRIMGV